MRQAALAMLAPLVLLASGSVHAQDRISANAVTDRTTLKDSEFAGRKDFSGAPNLEPDMA